jgi:hypothetical protein
MEEKELPPLGCVRLLLGLPSLVLAAWLDEPLQHVLLPLLPKDLSADADAMIYGFTLAAIVLGTWIAILRMVDLIFGTKFYPWGSRPDASTAGERAAHRLRGLLIVLSVIAADQALKFVFGVAHPQAVEAGNFSSPDAVLILSTVIVLFVSITWLRSRDWLQSLALSLLLAATASPLLDLALRGHAMVLDGRLFGLSFSLAELAGLCGVVLYVLSWFWEPGEDRADPS